jgi:midasin
MRVQRYLEDYPFEYYIVLRDPAVLPEVLGEALKQWYLLVGGERSE